MTMTPQEGEVGLYRYVTGLEDENATLRKALALTVDRVTCLDHRLRAYEAALHRMLERIDEATGKSEVDMGTNVANLDMMMTRQRWFSGGER